MTPNLRRERAGFTLVELLVVIAIIAFLAGLIIAFFPSINAQTAEANGAANLQGWLNIARQKAIRNQNPYGLRLWVKDPTLFVGQGATYLPGNPAMAFPTLFVTECQYIEQPDDFTGGIITTQSSLNNGVWDTVAMSNVDPTGGLSDPTLFPVQPGDYFEVLGTGLMHQILSVNTFPITPPGMPAPPPIPPPSLSLATGTPFQIGSGATNYRILRQPRVIGGETLALPDGVFIDLNTNMNTNISQPILAANSLPQSFLWVTNTGATVAGAVPPPNCTGAFVDVLFGPSGALITPGLTQNTMNLWVRQPDSNNLPRNNPANIYYGNPTIIAIFGQTGLVGAFTPSASSAAGPYVDIH